MSAKETRIRIRTTNIHAQNEANVHKMLGSISPNIKNKVLTAVAGLNERLDGYTDYEKLCLIFQMLTQMSYGNAQSKSLSNSFLAPFKYGEAVCEGFAEAFLLLIQLLVPKIRVKMLIGYLGDLEVPGNGHAWNQVCIDKKWHHVDVTHSLGKPTSTEYFLVSDEQMLAKDRWWPNTLEDLMPKCPTSYAGTMFQDPAKVKELTAYMQEVHAMFQG